MLIKVLVPLVCLAVGAWGVCPPEEVTSPCTCDEERLSIYCIERGDVPWDVKATFDRMSQFVPDDIIFEEITFTQTKLREFPAGALGSLKFRSIHIVYNVELEFIHPDAFNGTLETTADLSIANNDDLVLHGSNHSEADLYAVARRFTRLETLSLQNNGITSFSEESLGPMESLRSLLVCPGGLESLGGRFLEGFPRLTSAQFGYCDLTLEKLGSDTFEGVGSDVDVNLQRNPFTRLPEEIFRPLLESARRVQVGGQICHNWWCNDVELDCDEVSAWICDNVEKYEAKLSGFVCRVDSGFTDIWDYCAKTVN